MNKIEHIKPFLQKSFSEMSSFEKCAYYQQEVDSLEYDIRLAASMSEGEVREYFNTDSKEEFIELLNEELKTAKSNLNGYIPQTEDMWDVHGFRNERDYLDYRYN